MSSLSTRAGNPARYELRARTPRRVPFVRFDGAPSSVPESLEGENLSSALSTIEIKRAVRSYVTEHSTLPTLLGCGSVYLRTALAASRVITTTTEQLADRLGVQKGDAIANLAEADALAHGLQVTTEQTSDIRFLVVDALDETGKVAMATSCARTRPAHSRSSARPG